MSSSWVKKLQASDSRLHKEEVLKQALAAAKLGSYNAQVFLGLLNACYNPFVVFGVRQVEDTSGISNAENPWQDFNDLLYKLSARAITGNAAHEAIADIAIRFDSEEWNNFCAPVLRRDIRAGISDKTINKICKNTEYEIPIFGCQLATNSEGRPEMRGTKRLEAKLDGIRVLMTVIFNDEGTVAVSYSRNGKVFENFTHIENEIATNANKIIRKAQTSNLSMGFVLDGEVTGNSFQELMRQARRKENVQTEDSIFNVFDIIPLNEFRKGFWSAPLSKRAKILEDIKPIIEGMTNVRLVKHITVDLDTSEGRDVLHRYASDQVQNGFEGIMVKATDAPYECKRNTNWMKWKPIYDYDLTVIGMEEGTGKHAGRMGALVCEGIDDGKHITVNVGSGYTDEERQSYWDNKNSVLGRTAVVLADAVTLNQDNTYSLRFPRFKTFRDDK